MDKVRNLGIWNILIICMLICQMIFQTEWMKICPHMLQFDNKIYFSSGRIPILKGGHQAYRDVCITSVLSNLQGASDLHFRRIRWAHFVCPFYTWSCGSSCTLMGRKVCSCRRCDNMCPRLATAWKVENLSDVRNQIQTPELEGRRCHSFNMVVKNLANYW